MNSMDISVTLIQSNLLWEDIAGNLAMLGKKIDAINEPTDLILLPETFSTGFTMNVESVAEDMNGSAMNWMKEKTKEKNAVVCGSFICNDDGKIRNRLIWMRPDGTYEYYDKHHLFSYGKEDKHFAKGSKRLTVDLKGWKILPLICYD